jgi:hypothetical protein
MFHELFRMTIWKPTMSHVVYMCALMFSLWHKSARVRAWRRRRRRWRRILDFGSQTLGVYTLGVYTLGLRWSTLWVSRESQATDSGKVYTLEHLGQTIVDLGSQTLRVYTHWGSTLWDCSNLKESGATDRGSG